MKTNLVVAQTQQAWNESIRKTWARICQIKIEGWRHKHQNWMMDGTLTIHS